MAKVKAALARLLRFAIILVLAGIVYIFGYAIITAIREFFMALPVATDILFAFLNSNPMLLVICGVCIFLAAIFYDKIKKRIDAAIAARNREEER